MTLPIVQVGDPVLRAVARPIAVEELPGLQDLIAEMRDTMRAAPGVGLAAPQIGKSLAIAVIEDTAERQSQLTPEQLAVRERSAVPLYGAVSVTPSGPV